MGRKWLVAAAVLALALPYRAEAQWGFKIGGGIGIITGPTADRLSDGWNGQLGAVMKIPKKPFGFSFEFNNSWSSFDNLKSNLGAATGGHQNLWSLTLNAMLMPVRKTYYKGFNWYLIAGGGFYSRYLSIDGGSVVVPCYPYYWWAACSGTVTLASRTDNGFGVNGGGGIGYNYGQGMFYIESRYHYAWLYQKDGQVVPIVFGFRLGW